MKFDEDKNRRVTNRFLALGGTAAVIGIFATDPDLVNSITSQTIGYCTAVIAAIGITGAALKWAEKQDALYGKTIISEINDVKASFGKVLSRIRREFDDEFAINQGLDNKDFSTETKTKTLKLK